VTDDHFKNVYQLGDSSVRSSSVVPCKQTGKSAGEIVYNIILSSFADTSKLLFESTLYTLLLHLYNPCKGTHPQWISCWEHYGRKSKAYSCVMIYTIYEKYNTWVIIPANGDAYDNNIIINIFTVSYSIRRCFVRISVKCRFRVSCTL